MSLKTSDLFAESDVLIGAGHIAFYPVEMPKSESIASFPPESPSYIDVAADRQFSIKPPRYRAETASFRPPGVIHRVATEKRQKKPVKLTPKVHFPDTIIEIGHTAFRRQPSSIVERPESKESPRAIPTRITSETKPDKRSFVSTVLPIVKKPYGWIKAIGSKLF